MCYVMLAQQSSDLSWLVWYVVFSAWPPFSDCSPPMFWSYGNATMYFLESNWQTLTPQTLWKMQRGAPQLPLAEQVKFRQRIPKSKAMRSILVSFYLPRQHQQRSQPHRWLLGLPLCLDSAPPTPRAHKHQTSSLSSQNALGTRADL